MPGQANTVSITTLPPMLAPRPSAKAVTTGSRALRAAWRITIDQRDSPFMRAMTMNSSFSTSSMVARISSSGRPWRNRVSVSAGRHRCHQKSPDSSRCLSEPSVPPGLTAPPVGNQPSWNANSASSSMPSQNSGAARVARAAGIATASAAPPRRNARKAPATMPNA